MKKINVTDHIKRLFEKENPYDPFNRCRKNIYKIGHLFLIKTLSKQGLKDFPHKSPTMPIANNKPDSECCMFSPKNRYKMRTSIFITSIQFCTGGSSQCN